MEISLSWVKVVLNGNICVTFCKTIYHGVAGIYLIDLFVV
ncbi:hypothetical protein C942_00709 [Photobacterium marinum]|uniref:Uncharacterized protein n=1 Tax=Photobacterium marinum TaxID=1056511 RepID=L8J9Z1_9GAMM|nr:hypothetical protein C942_00709 [Photobacterium marinum]